MKKALIVGIDDYPSSPLTGCVSDASSMASILATNGDGSPNLEVKLMTSPSSSITKSTLRHAIESLFEGNGDMALLYFSGHGHIDNTGGYLVTTDAQQYDEGVSMETILSIANNSQTKNKIIILDCCYSGAVGTPTVTGGNLAMLSEGLSVLTASRESESAIEINGHGVFTSLLLDALAGGASDLRGNITPGSLYAYVDEALGAWDQRPIFKTNVTNFARIRRIDPRVPLEKLRKLTMYFPKSTDEHQLNPSYEKTEAGKDVNNVEIFNDLQAFEGVGLVVPVDEEHMYYAAINSKSCRLTALGAQYWRLAKEGKL